MVPFAIRITRSVEVSFSGNSIIGLEKVFVAKSADAHSKAKMYGCFELIHSMKSMLGPEER